MHCSGNLASRQPAASPAAGFKFVSSGSCRLPATFGLASCLAGTLGPLLQQCHGHAAIALEQTALSKALDDGMKDFNIIRQLSLTEGLGVQVTGPSIIGDLQCSLLHEELTECC